MFLYFQTNPIQISLRFHLISTGHPHSMVPGCHTDHDHGNAKACQQPQKAFPITVEWLVVPNFKSLNVKNWGFPMGLNHVFPKCVLRQVLISLLGKPLKCSIHIRSCQFSRKFWLWSFNTHHSWKNMTDLETGTDSPNMLGNWHPRPQANSAQETTFHKTSQNHRSGWSKAEFCLVLYMCFL